MFQQPNLFDVISNIFDLGFYGLLKSGLEEKYLLFIIHNRVEMKSILYKTKERSIAELFQALSRVVQY